MSQSLVRARSETAAAAAGLPAGTVRKDRRHVLDATDLDTRPRKRPQLRLRPRPRTLHLRAANGAELDVHAADVELLEARGDVLEKMTLTLRGRSIHNSPTIQPTDLVLARWSFIFDWLQNPFGTSKAKLQILQPKTPLV